MKKIIYFLAFSLCCTVVDAQEKTYTKKKQARGAPGKQLATIKKDTVPGRISLSSTGSYAAMGTPAVRMDITDLTVRTFTLNAANPSGGAHEHRPILGVSRKNYGIAHGKIILYSNTGGVSGGNTGTGSVGTGSSAIGIGTNGASRMVNGRSPFSAPGLYGSSIGDDHRAAVIPDNRR